MKFLVLLLAVSLTGCAAQKPVRRKDINPPQRVDFQGIEFNYAEHTATCWQIAELENVKTHSKVVICQNPWDAGQLGLPPAKGRKK